MGGTNHGIARQLQQRLKPLRVKRLCRCARESSMPPTFCLNFLPDSPRKKETINRKTKCIGRIALGIVYRMENKRDLVVGQRQHVGYTG